MLHRNWIFTKIATLEGFFCRSDRYDTNKNKTFLFSCFQNLLFFFSNPNPELYTLTDP